MWKDAKPSVEEDHFCGHNPIHDIQEKPAELEKCVPFLSSVLLMFLCLILQLPSLV